MTFKLIATITHKSFDFPVTRETIFTADTFESILDKIKTYEVSENHLHNLKCHRRTAFKDARGVKHSWRLEEMKT